jgi:hypothetical protein
MASPTPTPTANPYAHIKVTPVVHASTGTAAMPATVSTTTGASVIAAGAQRSAAHNALVLAQSGRKVSGGSKRKCKRSKCKRSKCKRSKCKRSKRSTKRFKRSKRGGTPTPTPTPTPKPSVVPVPQFSGAHNAGANANSVSSNHVMMNASSQAVFDNPNAPPSNTKVV